MRAIAAHKHAIETPVLVRIRCEAGFVKRRTVVDDQQVARLILVSVAKLRLGDLVREMLQEIPASPRASAP